MRPPPSELTLGQFVQALQAWGQVPPMWEVVSMRPDATGPRICKSGLLPYSRPDASEVDVLVWNDGLCLVSKRVWSALNGG
jgi:hypothetical protein